MRRLRLSNWENQLMSIYIIDHTKCQIYNAENNNLLAGTNGLIILSNYTWTS
jgi:hypothetical protein